MTAEVLYALLIPGKNHGNTFNTSHSNANNGGASTSMKRTSDHYVLGFGRACSRLCGTY